MMTVYLSSVVNAEGASYATAVQNVDRTEFLKEGYCMVVIDSLHRHRSVEMIRDEEGVE